MRPRGTRVGGRSIRVRLKEIYRPRLRRRVAAHGILMKRIRNLENLRTVPKCQNAH